MHVRMFSFCRSGLILIKVNSLKTPLNFLPYSETLENDGKLFRSDLTSLVNYEIAITSSASFSSERLCLSVPFQQSYQQFPSYGCSQ